MRNASTRTGINTSQQFTATYTAPLTVIPPNNQVTLTVASVIDPSASDYNQITIAGAATHDCDHWSGHRSASGNRAGWLHSHHHERRSD